MACFSHFETAPFRNERIAEFLDFAIQDKFAYVNKLERPQAAFYMENCSKFSRVRRRWSFFTNVGGSGSGLRPLFIWEIAANLAACAEDGVFLQTLAEVGAASGRFLRV
ncbi:MAG: hypothetical protein ACLUMK_09295 [Christensenellales bacterium]